MYPTGDVRLRRYAERANLAALPDPNSPSIRAGDRIFCRAESVMCTAVGPAGGRIWFEQKSDVSGDFKYWVAPAGSGRVNAPYTTIHDAQAAAAADGHSSTGVPANIYVTPGIYPESIVLLDGMNIIGVNSPSPMDIIDGASTTNWNDLRPIVSGQHSLDNSFVQGGFYGLDLRNGTGAQNLFTSPTTNWGQVTFSGCRLSKSAQGQVTRFLGNGGHTINFWNCQLENTTSQGGLGIAVLDVEATATINILDSSFKCLAADTAMSLAAAVTLRHRRGEVCGNIRFVAGASNATFSDVELTVSGAIGYIQVDAGAPTVLWRRGSMKGSTSQPNLVGTFTFQRAGQIESDTNGLQIAAAVTFQVIRTLDRSRTVRANGAADLTAANFLLADHHTLNTSAAARGVALPVGATYPPGQPVGISADQTGGAGANAITITPNGAETINGLNAAVVCAASVKGCCSLMRDPNSVTNWIVLSIT